MNKHVISYSTNTVPGLDGNRPDSGIMNKPCITLDRQKHEGKQSAEFRMNGSSDCSDSC